MKVGSDALVTEARKILAPRGSRAWLDWRSVRPYLEYLLPQMRPSQQTVELISRPWFMLPLVNLADPSSYLQTAAAEDSESDADSNSLQEMESWSLWRLQRSFHGQSQVNFSSGSNPTIHPHSSLSFVLLHPLVLICIRGKRQSKLHRFNFSTTIYRPAKTLFIYIISTSICTNPSQRIWIEADDYRCIKTGPDSFSD